MSPDSVHSYKANELVEGTTLTATIKKMEDSLNKINQQLQKQQHDIQRLNSKK